MKTLDERIQELKDLKGQWAEKYRELEKYVDNCNRHANSDTPDEIKKNLDGFGLDLQTLGRNYRVKIKEATDNVAKDYLDDSMIEGLVNGIINDIDNSGGTNGSREDRLKALAEIVDIINKLT